MDAAFLIVLGLELSRMQPQPPRSMEPWLHAGWMGVLWSLVQVNGLIDLGLGPLRGSISGLLSVAVILLGAQYLAIQYTNTKAFLRLPNIGMVAQLSTPLLLVASFMFIHLLVSTSLQHGAIFLAAAGYLVRDENRYASYLAPLGVLLISYSII